MFSLPLSRIESSDEDVVEPWGWSAEETARIRSSLDLLIQELEALELQDSIENGPGVRGELSALVTYLCRDIQSLITRAIEIAEEIERRDPFSVDSKSLEIRLKIVTAMEYFRENIKRILEFPSSFGLSKSGSTSEGKFGSVLRYRRNASKLDREDLSSAFSNLRVVSNEVARQRHILEKWNLDEEIHEELDLLLTRK